MAGGGSHSKSSSHKPPSSTSSHKKSRWESSSSSTANLASDIPKTNGNSFHNPPDSKPSNLRPSKPPSEPATPKQVAAKSPTAHSKPIATEPFHPPRPTPPVGGFPFSDIRGPPPLPSYGFHMLDRRTIVLANGSARSYFALPVDYQDLPPSLPHRPMLGIPEMSSFDRFPHSAPMSPGGFREGWNPMAGPGDGSLKRKYGAEEERHRQFLTMNGYPMENRVDRSTAGPSNPLGKGGDEMRVSKHTKTGGHETLRLKHLEVDQVELKKKFLHFTKLIHESPGQRRSYLEDGKQGRIQCLACGRLSKEFPELHGLILHAYNYDKSDLLVDHLGLHKALCVLMGWNYSKPPDNSKAYQLLPADEAAMNKDDLVIWPPIVIIHNTITGKGKEGRVEGLGNRTMDSKLRDLGFKSGKSKSLYARDGHLGITLVKFAADESGLKEALRLAEHFENEHHGRRDWNRLQPLTLANDDEKNPKLVKVEERTGERSRILYGYLATAADMDNIDFDTKKKVVIESQHGIKGSK